MKLSSYVSNLKLLHRNRQWLAARTKPKDKLLYYAYIPLSFLGALFGTKKVKYLGEYFAYDNYATPLNLQTYPYEIDKKILSNMDRSPKYILDIGGNIGQFSRTLSYFTTPKVLDIFEPNPNVIDILQANINHLGSTATVYNYALSANHGKVGKMYYQPGRSAVGSILEDNAGDKSGVEQVTIQMCQNPSSLTKRRSYNLIKVDVEGFEIEVIKSLEGMSTDYLFIEISSRCRSRNYNEAILFEQIRRILGDYELAYSTGFDGRDVAYEILLHFNVKHRSNR